MKSRYLTRRQGFTLVEIVIALAVISSAFLVVFGLLGVGLNTFHQSKAISVSSQIAQQVYSQLEGAPFANVVGSTVGSASGRGSAMVNLTSASFTNTFTDGTKSVTTLYFDDQGNELASAAGAIYWVNLCILYPSPIPPYTQANAAPPYLNVDLATVLVQVAYNPGGQQPTADSVNGYKWAAGTPMPIANYQFYVTRNS